MAIRIYAQRKIEKSYGKAFDNVPHNFLASISSFVLLIGELRSLFEILQMMSIDIFLQHKPDNYLPLVFAFHLGKIDLK